MARRSHAKTRTGCATCKQRRIKCNEERPECRNCIKHGVTCPGYTDVARTASSGSTGSRRRKSSIVAVPKSASESPPSTSRRGSAVSITEPQSPRLRHSPSPAQRAAIQAQASQWSRSFRLDASGTALFEHFCAAIATTPSVSFCTDQVLWLHEILPSLPQSMDAARSLLYTLLSFSASHMAFLTQISAYSRAAIVYRGYALQLLQGDLHGDLDLASPDAEQVSSADAAIGSAMLLADQAALEGDWRANTLHLRGVRNLRSHALRERRPSAQGTSGTCASKFALAGAARWSDAGTEEVLEIDSSALQRTADGRACLQDLTAMRAHFSQDASVYPAEALRQYAGTPTHLDTDAGLQNFRFVPGGLGHLFALACQIYALFDQVGTLGDASSTQTPAELHATWCRLLLLSQHWSVSVPKPVMTLAFEDDFSCQVLFAYKYGLDLLLHRSMLLLNPHLDQPSEFINPSPNVVLGNSFIGSMLQEQQRQLMTNNNAITQAHRSWLNWPAWVHTWSRTYTEPINLHLPLNEERRRSSTSQSFASSLDSSASMGNFAFPGTIYTHAQDGSSTGTPASTSTTPLSATFAPSALLSHPFAHSGISLQSRGRAPLAEIEEGVAVPDHAFFSPEDLLRFPEL